MSKVIRVFVDPDSMNEDGTVYVEAVYDDYEDTVNRLMQGGFQFDTVTTVDHPVQGLVTVIVTVERN